MIDFVIWPFGRTCLLLFDLSTQNTIIRGPNMYICTMAMVIPSLEKQIHKADALWLFCENVMPCMYVAFQQAV